MHPQTGSVEVQVRLGSADAGIISFRLLCSALSLLHLSAYRRLLFFLSTTCAIQFSFKINRFAWPSKEQERTSYVC